MSAAEERVTYAQVARLVKRLRSRREAVRLAAEAEVDRIGPAAAECWAASERAARKRERLGWRTLAGCTSMAMAVAVIACFLLTYEPLVLWLGLVGTGAMMALVTAAALPVVLLVRRWGRVSARRVLPMLIRVDDARVLDALLLALEELGWDIVFGSRWQACDRALDHMDKLPDEEAAVYIQRSPEPLRIALLRSDPTPDGVERALRLIALIRRTEHFPSATCLEELTTDPLVRLVDLRVRDAATECAAFLRKLHEERKRNNMLLRPAAAPTDTLLRPAGPPQDDPDLLLRPADKEE